MLTLRVIKVTRHEWFNVVRDEGARVKKGDRAVITHLVGNGLHELGRIIADADRVEGSASTSRGISRSRFNEIEPRLSFDIGDERLRLHAVEGSERSGRCRLAIVELQQDSARNTSNSVEGGQDIGLGILVVT